MFEWWPVLLGWPAMLAALALAGFGTFNKKPWYLYIGALLILPFTLYLVGSPRFGMYGLLPPLALVAAGVAVHRQKSNLAWALIFVVIAFFSWLIFVIQKAPG